MTGALSQVTQYHLGTFGMEQRSSAQAAPLVQLRVASSKLREVLGAVVVLPEEAQDQVADAVLDRVNLLRCVWVGLLVLECLAPSAT
jgi:hypothetical protein